MQYGQWCTDARDQLHGMTHAHALNSPKHTTLSWAEVRESSIECWSVDWEHEYEMPTPAQGDTRPWHNPPAVTQSSASSSSVMQPPWNPFQTEVFAIFERLERKIDWCTAALHNYLPDGHEAKRAKKGWS